MTILQPRCCLLLLAGMALFLNGCVGPWAKRLADRETYPIIEDARSSELGQQGAFSIEDEESELTRETLAQVSQTQVLYTTDTLALPLGDALALAIDNSRSYQREKEVLYLSALSLTEERHAFDPIFSGDLSLERRREPDGAGGVERFGTIDSSLGLDLLVATGARISVGLSNRLLRFYSGSPRESASGSLSGQIVQPLLQGAGTLVTLENLRQSERDLIYAVRNFERYRKRFVIDQIEAYYRLLQTRDQIENEKNAYERLILARERAEALEQAGRQARFQVDQALQDEIRARNRWISARADYVNGLDRYKVDLGLSIQLALEPSPVELEQLRQRGLVAVSQDLKLAEATALERRLDYRTACARVEDAERRLKIAENSLLPAVDLRVDYQLDDSGHNQPFDFDNRDRSYGYGMDVELPLDRKAQRNDYRRALINLERLRRDREQIENDIREQVRRAYLNMEEAQQSYEIQLQSLELARRRVDNVRMLLEAGRSGVNIRDQLEADAALRDAQNAVTRILIDHTLARLEFYYATELLEIDEQGMWEEATDETQ